MRATEHQYRDGSRAEMLSFVLQQAHRVLDVGCNQGGFGAALKLERPDIEVYGVEPNAEAAAIAAERLDRVVVGTFPEAVPGGSFDVITFLDVLEHMVDPLGALEAARGLLTPDGVVLASMPNVRHYTVASRFSSEVAGTTGMRGYSTARTCASSPRRRCGSSSKPVATASSRWRRLPRGARSLRHRPGSP